jgi:TIR domain/inactive STAND
MPLGPATAKPYKVFCSYAHEDERWRGKVKEYLSGLIKSGSIAWWCDREIPPGGEWDRIIKAELEQSDIFLCLVTAAFLASPYCSEIEFKRAIGRQQAGDAIIIPIAVDHCSWADSELQAFEAVPDPETPIIDKPSRRLTEVARRIEEYVNSIGLGTLPTGTALGSTAGFGSRQNTASRLENVTVQHVARPVPPLLPYLCDRSAQEQFLLATLGSVRGVPRRPVFLLVHGAREEQHDGFMARLEKDTLPRMLQMHEKPTRRCSVDWPLVTTEGRSPEQVFGPLVASAIDGCEPYATVRRIAQLLHAADELVVLTITVDTLLWEQGRASVLQSALQFWSAWPQLPPGRVLVVCMVAKYDSARLRDKKERERYHNNNLEIRDELRALQYPPDQTSPYPKLVLAVLPELLPVQQTEAEKFPRIRQVQEFCDPQLSLRWVDEIDSLYENSPALCMRELVPHLTDMLQRFAR